MRRKNKKIAKIVADKPSTSSTESEIALISDNSNSNSNKTDLSSSTNDLNSDPLKHESTKDSSSGGSDLNVTICSDEVYLCVELKLISIDQRCVDYNLLNEPFLCVSSSALVDHLSRLLVKKMKISEEFFEVGLKLIKCT